jgi:hypothetical protein
MLSSTTRARRLRRSSNGTGDAWGLEPRTKGRVNESVEPSPSRLLTAMEPPMRSTSCLAIASPRPVPPYCLVVEPSTWLNFSNTESSLPAGMPVPVSPEVNHRRPIRIDPASRKVPEAPRPSYSTTPPTDARSGP